MLGIILTYASCPEFLEIQVKNFHKFCKSKFTIIVVDDSENGLAELKRSDVLYFKTQGFQSNSPSARHQNAVKIGIKEGSHLCDSFLIMDNDMLFMNDFTKPDKNYYFPQKTGTIEYMWMNLIYLKSKQNIPQFDFYTCPTTQMTTDSGGRSTFFLQKNKLTTAKILDCTNKKEELFPNFFQKYKELCEDYSSEYYHQKHPEVLQIENTLILHFCSMSNWRKFPNDFFEKRKELILAFIKSSAI